MVTCKMTAPRLTTFIVANLEVEDNGEANEDNEAVEVEVEDVVARSIKWIRRKRMRKQRKPQLERPLSGTLRSRETSKR